MIDISQKQSTAVVTVAVPSRDQGAHLPATLDSILNQAVRTEICVADGGSTDNSADVLQQYAPKLHWMRSARDGGQSAAINEAMRHGSAPYVCWLNSDDLFLPGALEALVDVLEKNPQAPAAYGRTKLVDTDGNAAGHYPTHAFSEKALARRCFISQPSTLIRREVWESLDGLDENLHMAMDYDLWWRIYREFGELAFVDQSVAQDRRHPASKTSTRRYQHYTEAFAVLRRHYGRIPMIWYAKWPWSVWYKSRQNPQTTS